MNTSNTVVTAFYRWKANPI